MRSSPGAAATGEEEHGSSCAGDEFSPFPGPFHSRAFLVRCHARPLAELSPPVRNFSRQSAMLAAPCGRIPVHSR
jgi:hypothetical protein